MDHGIRREETAVHVRRNNVFEDSFRELFRRPPEEWKNRFYIVFEGKKYVNLNLVIVIADLFKYLIILVFNLESALKNKISVF